MQICLFQKSFASVCSHPFPQTISTPNLYPQGKDYEIGRETPETRLPTYEREFSPIGRFMASISMAPNPGPRGSFQSFRTRRFVIFVFLFFRFGCHSGPIAMHRQAAARRTIAPSLSSTPRLRMKTIVESRSDVFHWN